MSRSGWFPDANNRPLLSVNCLSFSESCSYCSTFGRRPFSASSLSRCCWHSLPKCSVASASLSCRAEAVGLSAASINPVTISRVASRQLFCLAMSCFSFWGKHTQKGTLFQKGPPAKSKWREEAGPPLGSTAHTLRQPKLGRIAFYPNFLFFSDLPNPLCLSLVPQNQALLVSKERRLSTGLCPALKKLSKGSVHIPLFRIFVLSEYCGKSQHLPEPADRPV